MFSKYKFGEAWPSLLRKICLFLPWANKKDYVDLGAESKPPTKLFLLNVKPKKTQNLAEVFFQNDKPSIWTKKTNTTGGSFETPFLGSTWKPPR